jgi:hypothetical protein
MSDVTDFIQSMINDQSTIAIEKFNSAISDRIDTLLSNKKIEVLDTYFNKTNTEGEE